MSDEPVHIVPIAAHGSRLDAFAAGIMGCGVRAAKRLAQAGRILADGKPRPPHYKLEAGTAVTVSSPAPERSSPEIRLAAAGADYAAFIKPAGLHTAAITGKASPSLERAIREQWAAFRQSPVFATVPEISESLGKNLGGPFSSAPPSPGPFTQEPPVLLSRLDEATSGLVAAAFTPEAAEAFRAMETAGRAGKYYMAVVHGTVEHPFCMENALDTDNRKTTRVLPEPNADSTRHTAVTPIPPEGLDIPALEPGKTLVAAHIRRGARHQIRAHLAHAGFPILGDTLYGPDKEPFPLHLHHARLVFPGFDAACFPNWLRIL